MTDVHTTPVAFDSESNKLVRWDDNGSGSDETVRPHESSDTAGSWVEVADLTPDEG